MMRRFHKKRGSGLLEFALVLPLFLMLVCFVVDMGRMTFYSAVVHDAAFSAARAGAQVGTAGSASSGASRTAFNNAVDSAIPGGSSSIQNFVITSGAPCAATGTDAYVTVKGSVNVSLVTPGLYALLNVTSSNSTWALNASSAARCEVVRS